MLSKADGVTLDFGEQAKPAPGRPVPVFGMNDIATARASLEAAGVSFNGNLKLSTA